MTLPDVINTDRLELVLFTKAHMELLIGRGPATELPFDVPNGWAQEEGWLLGLRVGQIDKNPAEAPWLLRAILWAGGSRQMIGHAGFHAGPDEKGRVEIGYSVFPEHRRRGVAEEAATTMLRQASRDPRVEAFRASVSPRNEPSLALVRKLGFVQTGVQWDELDGEELVFERPAPFA